MESINNLLKIFEKYNIISQKILSKNFDIPKILDPNNIHKIFMDSYFNIMSNPQELINRQLDFINKQLEFFASIKNGKESLSEYDSRFKDDKWAEYPLFNYFKNSYLYYVKWINHLIDDLDGLDENNHMKLKFFLRQITDALSPTNFVLLNPVVVEEVIKTKGENLIKGLDNLLDDIEKGNRFINIHHSDESIFKLGENIASTKGKIVYKNDLIELIHYTALLKETYSIPLLVVPPWINKYYILDLSEKNSFIKWLLEQGHQVFLISWVNPDKSYADKKFDDYMLEGPIAALDVIANITGQNKINTIGYCIGGTLLASTAAYMAKKKDNRINSMTLLTTLLDFQDAGELALFLDESAINKIEESMKESGFFDGYDMAAIFSILRANDLIWSFFIHHYLLGKEPLPFDILYWNSDSTRLPCSTHNFYLRSMYLSNLLAKPNGIILNGESIDLGEIHAPVYFLSTKDDHIAPWICTYKGTKLINGNVVFTLAGSGHVAGVINHPNKNKYGFWKNNNIIDSADKWLENSIYHEGSWWCDWQNWICQLSGNKVNPIISKISKTLGKAPGKYILMK